MKILIYGNRKQDDNYYDISSPEKRSAAFLLVFKELDEYWSVYNDVSGYQKKLYDKAKQGDGAAAEKLLLARNGYEYEEVRTAEVENPLESE